MPSYQKVYYCKNCKTNVGIDEKNHCKKCGSANINTSWSVRFRYVNEQGNEIQKRLSGFNTKKDAETDYTKFMATSKKYVKLEDAQKELSFIELFEEYKNYAKTRIKSSSYYDFCSKVNRHVLPFFKNFKVKNIMPKDILDWQNSVNNYSYNYKTGLRAYLNTMLCYAEKYYELPNKVRHVDNFRNNIEKKEMLFWTPQEFNKFISSVENETYKTFFYALYYTGARKGEMLASHWTDWDLEKGILNINKSITFKTFGSTWAVTTPKNSSSIRKVSLPSVLINIMKNYKVGKENSLYAFGCDRPLPETSLTRALKVGCDKSGVKKVRIHDFRHSHASLLISQGASIVGVAKRLGHTNIEQTLNTYAHMLPEEDSIILNILENTKNK